jgi:N utilization substance protein B
LEKIDSLIESNLENWKLSRLSNIDRNILRLTSYELLFNEEVPQNAAINEAIELAKLFGDDQSPKFINAVLSKIKESL